jgi:hypothetical protein
MQRPDPRAASPSQAKNTPGTPRRVLCIAKLREVKAFAAFGGKFIIGRFRHQAVAVVRGADLRAPVACLTNRKDQAQDGVLSWFLTGDYIV